MHGWELAPSFRLPETVPSDSRIGKSVAPLPTIDDDEIPLTPPDSVSGGAQLVAVQEVQGAGSGELVDVAKDTRMIRKFIPKSTIK